MIVLIGEPERVDFVRFSPDARTLAASTWSTVQVFTDLRDKARPSASVIGFTFAPQFTPDGTALIRYAKGLTAWNWATNRDEPLPFTAPYALSPDGRTAVVASRFFLSRLPLKAGPPAWSVPVQTIGWDELVFIKGGSLLATLEWDDQGKHLVTRDSDTGTVLAEANVTVPAFNHLTATANRNLVAGHWTSLIAVYRADDLGSPPVLVRNDNRKHFTDLAFHPSGDYLAATSNDSTVKLYDTRTWQMVRAFDWKIGRLRSVAFSPDGMLAAAGSDRGKVVIWDVDC